MQLFRGRDTLFSLEEVRVLEAGPEDFRLASHRGFAPLPHCLPSSRQTEFARHSPSISFRQADHPQGKHRVSNIKAKPRKTPATSHLGDAKGVPAAV